MGLPNQPRDKGGKFAGSSTGGGSTAPAVASSGTDADHWTSEQQWEFIVSNNAQKQAAANMDTAVMNSMETYTGWGSEDINSNLREKRQVMSQHVRRDIKNLDEAFDKYGIELNHELYVYRGFGDRIKFDVDDMFTDRGYVSTSLTSDIAIGFSGSAGVARIRVPPRTRFLVPQGGIEKEVLFKRGTSFKVTGRRPSGTRIDLATGRPRARQDWDLEIIEGPED